MSSVFYEILGKQNDLKRTFIAGSTPATFGDLLNAVDLIDTCLREMGCGLDDRVGICLDQSLEYVASLLAVRKRGSIGVLMSLDWTDHEKEWIFSDSETRFMITNEPGFARQSQISFKGVGGLDCVICEYDNTQKTPNHEDDSIIIYSSGTTGKQKAVILTDSGISSNVRAVSEYLELCSDDSSPMFTPTCYAYSLSQVLTHALVGAAILPIPTRLMFPMEILDGISRYGLTGISATPTAFRVLLDLKHEETLNFSSVRYVMAGGQPLDFELTRRLVEKFKNSKVVNMYGCTENSPRISYFYINGETGLSQSRHFAVGKPVCGTEIRILTNNGKYAKPDEIGEIVIKGTSLMRGYLKDPQANEKRLCNGWFYTGDLGYIDQDGLLYLTGRIQTIINVGNEKVSPEEVEMILCEIEGIEESLVYGVSDSLLGERVCANIKIKQDSDVKTVDIQRYCREKLSGYKIPRQISIVDSIPRTLYGKIDRKK